MDPSLDLHACTYTQHVFDVLGKRWTGLIIDLLLQRPARYNELVRAIPQLTKRVLTQRLAELQAAGLVARDVDEGPPLAVTYRLTSRGEALRPAMDALRVWAGAPVDAEGVPLAYQDHRDQ
ncbi:winged helix-turn-helix transcriptional regulator [Nocardioides luteus]|uniref:Transcriptional regulator n=1 Tax=Nocardioides luteus TaxID=1844 RepID=A0A1J4N7H4_9ACTN|nr:helix-turn-helix domain-containing protein [Nocardioides luteus]OIJ27461.1 transcriptional regulator [Nocardioides luteus]